MGNIKIRMTIVDLIKYGATLVLCKCTPIIFFYASQRKRIGFLPTKEVHELKEMSRKPTANQKLLDFS